MLPETLKNYSSEVIQKTLFKNHNKLLSDFYEMQSEFLRARYKINKSIEISNILTLLGKNLHLEIVRQRERDLNFDISLSNFLKIYNLKEYKVIRTTSEAWAIWDRPRIVVFDKKNNCSEKIFIDNSY